MSTEVAKQNTAMVPSYIANKSMGTDNIAPEDIQIPRLALAQKMSPEVDASTSKHIEGLSEGELFNSLTHDVYGPGPMDFAVVRVERPRAMQFAPIVDGGGVRGRSLAGAVPGPPVLRPTSSSRRKLKAMRLRAKSTSKTLTRTMSPGFTIWRGSLTKLLAIAETCTSPS